MGRSNCTWLLRSELWLLGELGGEGKRKGQKIWQLVMREEVDEELLLLENEVAALRLPESHRSSVVQSGAPPPSYHYYRVTFCSNDAGDADLWNPNLTKIRSSVQRI